MTALRIVASIVAIGLWTYFMAITDATRTLALGGLAGQQFQNSDAATMNVMTQMSFFQIVTSIPSLVVLAVLIILWYRPVVRLISD